MKLADVRRWLAEAPPGTMVPAHELLAMLDAEPEPTVAVVAPTAAVAGPTTWRERLWTAPEDTRLGVPEVAEAMNRGRDWVYRHTAPAGSGPRIPHRELDGQLVFVVAELRVWLRDNERIVEPGRRRGLRVARP